MGVSRSSEKSTPAPKSSATTEYSGIKKRAGAQEDSLSRSKSAEPTKYIVTRETVDYHNDPHGGLQDTSVVGIFSSRQEANKAARADLLRQWDQDFFESYEVEEDNGLVTVTAICPEGEEMTVTVQEAPRKKRSLGAEKPSASPMQTVYIVKQKTIDYHADRRGRIQTTAVVGTFSSRKKANRVARTNLLKDWSMDFFDSHDVEKEGGLVQVTAMCPEGELITVTVEEGQLAKKPDKDSEEESDEDSDEESDDSGGGSDEASEVSDEESNEESDEGPDEGPDEDSDEGSEQGFDEEY